MAKLYLGGPGGCGKTTVCERMVALHPKIRLVSGAEVMIRTAGVLSREELETLPEDVKDVIRNTAFTEYYKGANNILAEGHFWLTKEDAMYFDAFVLIETPIDLLVRFRSQDTRLRSLDPGLIACEIGDLESRIAKLQTQHAIHITRVGNNSSIERLLEQVNDLYMSFGRES